MQEINRRHFFTGAAALSIGASRILGANDRVNIATIGVGGRGRNHVSTWLGAKERCNLVALCDVNQTSLERSEATVTRSGAPKPKGFGDMRKLFEDKEIDAVSMATPNHWHALGTIWACQAGKDVYVEKPASHNIFEGIKMVEAARKYKRMVQVGSQGRSMPHKIQAMKLLREGIIGKVYESKGLCFKRRRSINRVADTPVPPGVDWDMFLGPAPMRPFNQSRYAYNWHWFWDTGNGDIGNQGIHQLDIARWPLEGALPVSAVSTGGKYVYDDDQETPNTQYASMDYGTGVELCFEVRGLPSGGEGGLQRGGDGNTIGNLYLGADGWMALDDRQFTVYKGEKAEVAMEVKSTRGEGGESPHFMNFLDGVKSRDIKTLNAEVEIGAASAVLIHLSNIAYRLKRRVNFDPKTMKFINDAEANKMITREYRKPYVVPDKV